MKNYTRACVHASLVLLIGTAAAIASPVYTIYGSANGQPSGYISSSGASSCSYSPGSGGAVSCQIDNSGVIPLTYNTFTAQGVVSYPDFGGDNTGFIGNLSSSGDAAGLHSSISLDVNGNIEIPGFTGSFADPVRGGGGNGSASAEQQDALTPIAPAGWGGQPFYMAFTFQADGEQDITVSPGATIGADSYAYGQVQFQLGLAGSGYDQIFQFPSYNVDTVGDFTFNDSITTTPMEITSLNAFEYYFTLETTASISCGLTTLGVCSASASAQMANTATLTGIEFEDANGNPIPGFSLDSSSGTNYDSLITSNQSSAPEPGTLWMFGGGLALVGIRRLRRRGAWLFPGALLLCAGGLQAQSIAISPLTPTVATGASVQFMAQTSGLAPGVTVTWWAGGEEGGSSVFGTISQTGWYTAPATVPATNPVAINAFASDGSVRTKTSVTVVAAGTPTTPAMGGTTGVPSLISVMPTPLPVGNDTVTIQGSGFLAGALIYESYGSQSMIQYPAATVLSGSVTANIYQGAGSTATFCVKNPGTACSNSITVPITSSAPSGTSTNVPALISVMPTPLPVGNDTVTIQGSGFLTGALVYESYGSQSMIQYAPTTVLAGSITLSIYQGSGTTATFCVKNPGSACSNSIAVAINSGPPAPQSIAPASVSVNLGGTQQFISSGATGFTATAGTITSGGFYTAPATMPSGSGVTVTVTGPGGTATATVTLVNPNPQIIAPTTVTLSLGGTQQFISAGGSNWTATFGTVTSAGFYTAPSVWPASGADTVSVTGPNGNASAAITLTAPTPVIASVGSNNQLPLGIFSAAITGSGFTAQSTVTLGGSAVTAAYSGGSINISGFYGQSGAVNLIVNNGSVASQPFTVQVGVPNALVSTSAARRFLQQAGFGPTPADAAHVQAIGFQAWLAEQFAMPVVSNYNALAGANQGGMPNVFLANAVTNPDQLRQKVAFALSQIFVTSLNTEIWDTTMVPFQQMLLGDAFTNYQQILTDVTLSPAMGEYLNMANNAQANAAAGTAANENYAREVMQLMSIGTKVLNSDGTWPVDSNNLPLPTYQQSDVTAMARIFTGWAYAPVTPGGPIVWNAFINPNAPMVAYPSEHDLSGKTVMGYMAAPGLSITSDLTNVLYYLANHPNTAPFISKQLIQHLVKSNPSTGYVSRVSTAFTQSQGDMPTVITAILLDPEARANDAGGNDQPTDGHLQEPALLVAGVVRAFAGQMTPANYYSSTVASMGQDIFSAPSVFNYYSPGYVVGGTGGLSGPEFQIDNPNAAVLRENFVATLLNSYSNPVLTYGPGTTIDLTPFLALANNPTALVNALDLTLTEGVMPQGLKTIIVNALGGNQQNSAVYQVETAAYLILVSNYYNVWH